MIAVTFDYFKKLEQVGFTQEQATVLVALATEVNNEMATKQELVTFEKDIKYEIELSESKIENVIKELKIELLKEIQSVRLDLGGEMQGIKGDVKFIKGLCVFIAGVISTAGVLFGMVKFFL